MNGKNALPKGWAVAPLSEVAAPRRERVSPVENGHLPFIGMEHVEAHTMRLLDTVPSSSMKSSAARFRAQDVLYGRLRPYLNKVYRPDFEGLCSAEFIVLPDTPILQSSFLQYRLNASDFVSFASHLDEGDRPRVNFDQIGAFEIGLPPEPEQRRIVAKIEELFSDLDAGVAALERVKANLKRYRAAVLKAAVEGRLAEQWRAGHPDVEPASELLKKILAERREKWEADQLAKYAAKGKSPPENWKDKYKEPAPPDTANLPELPEGWGWATLDQLGKLDRGRSRHRPRNAPHLYNGPYPFVQTGDIRAAEQYVRAHKQTYNDAGLAQSKLWPASTLCITIAANIAETAILAYEACFPDSVVGVVFDESKVSVRYVEFRLRTIRERLEDSAPATTQKNINNHVLRQVAIALPTSEEQREIVAEIEERLSKAMAAEQVVAAATVRAARLRQAILKRAFEGKLVSQDPKDEPASVLLERIRAERETHDAKPKLRKSRKRSGTKKAKRHVTGTDIPERSAR